jgi:hypothetical protein
MPKYKLLKDMPDADAGTIFTDDREDSGYHYSDKLRDNDGDGWISKRIVENNPKWFEKIPEQELVWTDDLVREYATHAMIDIGTAFHKGDYPNLYNHMRNFKESKMKHGE